MKNRFILNLTACLCVMAPIQAKSIWNEAKESFDSGWRKTKTAVQKGFEKTKTKAKTFKSKADNAWDNLSPESKQKIKAAFISAGTAAGTAIVAGAGYAAYKGTHPDVEDQFEDELNFLTTDPAYKGKISKQRDYLNHTYGLSKSELDKLIDAILDIEEQE